MKDGSGITVGRRTITAPAGHTLSLLESRPAAAVNRPPVLLVHGAWHGAWCWQDNFLEYFASRGHPTIALDLRGHGESGATGSMRFNRIRDYADDIAAAIEDIGAPPFVIGHSMGGFACQHLLAGGAVQGARMAGIGLLATVPWYGVAKVTGHIALTRPLDFAKVNLKWSLYPLVADPQAAGDMFLDGGKTNPGTAALAERLIDESYLAFLDMLILALPGRPSGNIPVRVIGGSEDRLFPPGSQQSTARRLNADCTIIEGAAHDVMLSARWLEAAEGFGIWMDEVERKNGR